MRELTPMLRLDLYTVRLAAPALLVASLIWGLLAAGGLMSDFTAIIPMAGVLGGTFVFQADQADKLGLLYDTLPMRRRTVVISHYLTGLWILVIVAVVVSLPVAGAIVVAPGVVDVTLVDVAVAVEVGIVVMAIAVPTLICFGPYGFFVIFLGFVALALVATLFEKPMADIGTVSAAIDPTVGLGVGAVLAVVAYGVSVLVAIRRYDREEH